MQLTERASAMVFRADCWKNQEALDRGNDAPISLTITGRETYHGWTSRFTRKIRRNKKKYTVESKA
jgi:hypothetical protein